MFRKNRIEIRSLLILCAVQFLISGQLTAQQPSILWNNIYGGTWFEQSSAIQETNDGNIAVFGTSSSYHPDELYKSWLFLLDQNGQLLWSKVYGDSNEVLRGRDAKETSDGGFILAGSLRNPDFSVYDAYMVKTNSIGEIEWVNQWDSDSTTEDVFSVVETSDGGYAFAGADVNDSTGVDILIIKLDPDGNEIWSHVYGDSGYEITYSIDEVSDGGFVITGGVNPIGTVPLHLTLAKTDSEGNLLWNKNYWAETWGAIGYDIKETHDGGFIIAGWKRNVDDEWGDGWLLKTDSIGDSLWARQMTFGFGPQDRALKVIQTPDEGFIVTGGHSPHQQSMFEIFLLKTDPDGNIQWQESYEGHEGLALDQTQDGNILLAGDEWIDNDVRWQVRVLKTDAQGLNFYIDRNKLDFGFVDKGTVSSDTITLFNIGNEIITIDSVRNNVPVFDLTSAEDTVEIGDSLKITIQFSPVNFEIYSDLIEIFTSKGVSAIEVRGTAGSGFIGVSTDFVSFGHVDLDTIVYRSVDVKNIGQDSLVIYSTRISNPIFSANVPDSILLPNESVTLELVFNATDSIAILDSLLINSSGGIARIYLYGNASTKEITVSRQNIDFGSIENGTAKTEELIIFNTGGQPLDVNDLFLLSPAFSVIDSSYLLFPDDSVSINVTFAPEDSGRYQDILIILGKKESADISLEGSSIIIGVEHEKSSIPVEYHVDYNYPNPFNPVTTIEYSLPRSGEVSLIIYNLLGQEVTRLVDGFQPAGMYEKSWNASNVSTGIYFYRLQAGEFVQTRKMLLLK